MNEPIDHAAEAREFLARARAGQNNILAELSNDDSELDAEDLMLAQEGVSAAASQANAHATLALVAAQDRANELQEKAIEQARMANIIRWTTANGSEPGVEGHQEIVDALWPGGESDGE